jgi:hypothetical protein
MMNYGCIVQMSNINRSQWMMSPTDFFGILKTNPLFFHPGLIRCCQELLDNANLTFTLKCTNRKEERLTKLEEMHLVLL